MIFKKPNFNALFFTSTLLFGVNACNPEKHSIILPSGEIENTTSNEVTLNFQMKCSDGCPRKVYTVSLAASETKSVDLEPYIASRYAGSSEKNREYPILEFFDLNGVVLCKAKDNSGTQPEFKTKEEMKYKVISGETCPLTDTTLTK